MSTPEPPRAQLIYTDVPGSLPADFVIPANLDLDLSSSFAKIDGSAAASAFLPCLTLLSQDGKVIARVKQDDLYAVGDTGDATWSPFLRSTGGVATSTTITSAAFANAAGFITITSTNLSAPDTIVTAPNITADGLTTYKIEFCVAAIDIQTTVNGNGLAFILQLLRGSTILGIIANYNIEPQGLAYGSIPVLVAAFDTPPAGTYAYAIGGVKIQTAPATGTFRVYGDNAGAPFDAVTHPGYISVSAVTVV